MGRTAFCLPLAILFLASVISSKAQKTEAAVSSVAGEESRVTVAAGAPLTVECRLRPEQRAEWRRDGGAPPPDLRAAPEAPAPDARLAARLRAPAARAHHAGLYTCSRERDHRVRVVVLPAAGTAACRSSPHRLRRFAARARARSRPPGPGDAALASRVGPGSDGSSFCEAPAPTTAPAPASAPAPVPSDDLPELLYDVRGNFSLHCQLPNDNSLAYVWKKNETDIEQVWELKDRYQLERGGAEFRVARAYEDDFGNYSCALTGQASEQRWAVRGRPHLKLPANTNVVEGQKLKLVCKVVGKPYSRVSWAYTNSTEPDANFTDATEVLGSRASLADSEQGVPDGVLLLDEARRADAGRYRCGAAGALLPAVTTLRVKDMYAALWPFLGICAEVFVLCAIILVYEKRRTKPELDDSDTDNHDQKKS
ncbi:uncharacterized protein LOC126774698 [Nymphalis io]|uniref:uncharacterized protein LOC126774698 n=1 Tax=Inachis io TaxID=171585 RepID=UPI002169C467|nr:uncharacterized protein LOC126774698 [Nymphalis io]